MRYAVAAVAAAIVVGIGVIVVAQPANLTGIGRFGPEFTQQAQRACLFPIGGWAKIDCSNAAAAQSAQLNRWSRYVIQCGDDSYIATGDQSTDEADANDGYLPDGAWLEFLTTDSVRYISCLNVNADSDCRIWECQ